MSRSDLNGSFIEKVWELVNVPQADLANLISWTEPGTSFVIKDPEEFARLALPRFFKHSNYSSFVRQLNMYGFHKNKSDLSINEFSHKCFSRDKKELIMHIKRKALQSSDVPPPTRGSFETRQLRLGENPPKNVEKYQQEINQLRRENQELKSALQKESMQKRNIMEKIKKFLTSLSAEMVALELSNNEQENQRGETQKLSMETINNLMNHFTSSQFPLQYEVYEKYLSALLYLVPLKVNNPRQKVTIRNNVIIRNSQAESS